MEEEDKLASFTSQISQIKAAVRSLLWLGTSIGSADESQAKEVAAAVANSFAEHVPNFKYDEQNAENRPDTRFQVEAALKGVLTETVQAAAKAQQNIMAYRADTAPLPSLPQLLDLARYLANTALVDQTHFLQLIADLVEICTIDEGAEIFVYLENCVPLMKARLNFESMGSPPKLAVLRICNQLLRRLSKAHHVMLAGRIHIFLSLILPSTDRSAVNATGLVNESHAINIEDVEDALDTDGKPVNMAFYKQFWSLQQFFQKPTSATGPNLWLQVYAGIKAALSEFGKLRTTVAAGSINSSMSGAAGEQEGLTVSYLSSPKLLHLQLRDAGFRRHFLVQCLVLLQACSRKSIGRQDTFKVKQQGEADDLQELLFKELERTPQHGLQFARAMRALMHHEDQWADWKADGAKSFERQKRPLTSVPPPAKRRRVSQPASLNLGTRELSRLWNLTPDNLSAIQQANRRHVPTLREFLEPVVQEMDPEEGIEDPYKRKQDPVFRWEALRQIAKESRMDLAQVVRTKDQNLEEAVRMLFPHDVPAGAQVASAPAAQLADASELGPPPGPGPAAGLLGDAAEAGEGDEEGELQADADTEAVGDVEMADAEPTAAAGTIGAPPVPHETSSKISPASEQAGTENRDREAGSAAGGQPVENGVADANGNAEADTRQAASHTNDTDGSIIARAGKEAEQSSAELIEQQKGGKELLLQEGKVISLGDSFLSLGDGKSNLSEVQKPS